MIFASRFFLALSVVILMGTQASGTSHYLTLGDLNQEPTSAMPVSAGVGPTDSAVYFFAGTDPERGTELWSWNGSNQATLLADLRRGPESSFPAQFTQAASGRVVFVADDGVSGPELWVISSNVATLLTDGQPGKDHPAPQIIGAAGGYVWFTKPGPLSQSARSEVWVTNGTTVSQVGQVSVGSVSRVTPIPSRPGLLFIASPVGGSNSLLYWAGGTQSLVTVGQIRDSGTPALPSTPVYAATSSFVCFQHTDINDEPYVWPYTGSALALKDINPSGNSAPSHFVSNGTTTVCFAATGAAGRELWQTNGSGVSTVQVHDTAPGAASSNPEPVPMSYGQRYIFYRATVSGNAECWCADTIETVIRQRVDTNVTGWMLPTMSGSDELLYVMPAGGAWQLKRVKSNSSAPENLGSTFTSVEALWNHVRADDGTSQNPHMIATTPSAGTELWKVRTTTVTLVDVSNSSYSSAVRGIAAQGAATVPNLMFIADAANTQAGLYAINDKGALNAVVMALVDPFSGGRSSFPGEYTEVADGLFFTATTWLGVGQYHRALYATQGRVSSTRMVNGVQQVEQVVKFQDRVYFLARRVEDTQGIKELHYATLDANGQVQFARHSDAAGYEVKRLVAAAGKLFYVRQDHAATSETLCCLLPDFSEGESSTFTKGADNTGITQLTAASGHLYFSAWSSGVRRACCVDGVNAVEILTSVQAPQLLGALGDAVVMTYWEVSAYQIRLWEVGVSSFSPGNLAINNPVRLGAAGAPAGVVFDGAFYFTVGDGTLIYKTSFMGLEQVHQAPFLRASPRRMGVLGGKLYFLGNLNPSVSALQSLDAAGTHEVVFSGGAGQGPTGLTVLGGSLYFGLSAATQTDFYRSDGAAPGTATYPLHHDLTWRDLSGYDLPVGTLRGHIVVPYEEPGRGLEPAVINAPPEMGSLPWQTGLRGQPVTFDYDDIMAVPPTDEDGDPVKVTISSVPVGQLYRNGEFYNGGGDILPGDTFVWHPPAGFSGPITMVQLGLNDGFETAAAFIGGTFDSPFDLWVRSRFTEEELLDGLITGAWSDPDGDGVVNALEFVFGREPKDEETGAAWSADVHTEPGGQRYLRLRFIRAASLTEGTKLVIEHSPSLLPDEISGLIPWSEVNSKVANGPWALPALITETTLPDGRVQVDASLPDPLDGSTAVGFMRLRVEP